MTTAIRGGGLAQLEVADGASRHQLHMRVRKPWRGTLARVSLLLLLLPCVSIRQVRSTGSAIHPQQPQHIPPTPSISPPSSFPITKRARATMHSRFIAVTLASLTLASQALAWGCIGQDCNDAANQIAFSVPQPEQAEKSAWDPTPGGGWQWSSCGTGDEVVSVDSIVVSPDPPVPGQNLTVRAKGTIKDEVSDGTFADVVVKLGLIRLLARRFDVCEEARANNADLQCPLSAGDYELEQTVALPREIPPGKFNVHVTGENQDGSNLVCLDLSIQFGFRR